MDRQPVGPRRLGRGACTSAMLSHTSKLRRTTHVTHFSGDTFNVNQIALVPVAAILAGFALAPGIAPGRLIRTGAALMTLSAR